jgi:hypothetical protein
MLSRFRGTIEYLAGERDECPPFLRGHIDLPLRLLVWAFAILLIYSFSGQSSKFIYIDF